MLVGGLGAASCVVTLWSRIARPMRPNAQAVDDTFYPCGADASGGRQGADGV
jgi:hypothetical protein